MSFILQTQRRAIESLKPYVPKPFWPSGIFSKPSGNFLKKEIDFKIAPRHCEGTPALYFYGISKGIGSCSDIHGMDVAVFGYRIAKRNFGLDWFLQGLPFCAYAVLLWPCGVVPLRTGDLEETAQIDPNLHDPTEPVQVVELIACHGSSHGSLWPTQHGGEFSLFVYFQRTGFIVTYKPLC